MLKLHTEIGDDGVGQPPQGGVARVLLPVAGNVPVVPSAVFYLKELPRRPGIAVPHQQLKHIVPDDGVVFVRPKHLIGAAGQGKGGLPFPRQLHRQAVKQGQPRFIIVLRYLDDLSGQHHKETFGAVLLCHARHLRFWPSTLYGLGRAGLFQCFQTFFRFFEKFPDGKGMDGFTTIIAEKWK